MSSRPGFDCDVSASPFLSFVASEFHKRGTQRRSELAKKSLSHPFVERLGLHVPHRFFAAKSLDYLDFDSLPDRFVLKFARGWSARGVMPLEKTAPDTYFDHLSLRLRNRESILRTQAQIAESFRGSSEWLVEEFVKSTLPVAAIPFDYKIYSFNGTVGLIGQFDRNASPPRYQMFDGRFRPLRHGRDYLIASPRLQPGLPVVPLHAPELLWWAQHLSKQADSPFVSVDMYDTPDGPVFGEFTYSPGAVHKRMFVLSHDLLDSLDAHFAGEAPDCPLQHSPLEERKRFRKPSSALFGSLAGYFYNSGPRGALRLAELYREYHAQADSPTEQAWMKRLSGTWQGIGESYAARIRAKNRKFLQAPAPPQ